MLQNAYPLILQKSVSIQPRTRPSKSGQHLPTLWHRGRGLRRGALHGDAGPRDAAAPPGPPLKASLSDEENYPAQKDTLDRASWQRIGSLVAITSMWESLEALNGGSTTLNHIHNFYNISNKDIFVYYLREFPLFVNLGYYRFYSMIRNLSFYSSPSSITSLSSVL